MDWALKSISALSAEKLFEDTRHQTRFSEFIDCFSSYPFFTRGLCKCMYLSAWDEEHFCILLETLTDLSLGRETTTQEMSVKGEALAEDQSIPDDEAFMYQFSKSLLENAPIHIDPELKLSDQTRYIVRRALQASEIIDSL